MAPVVFLWTEVVLCPHPVPCAQEWSFGTFYIAKSRENPRPYGSLRNQGFARFGLARALSFLTIAVLLVTCQPGCCQPS